MLDQGVCTAGGMSAAIFERLVGSEDPSCAALLISPSPLWPLCALPPLLPPTSPDPPDLRKRGVDSSSPLLILFDDDDEDPGVKSGGRWSLADVRRNVPGDPAR